MISKTIGFIGGGRITRIFLTAFKQAGISIDGIVVSDSSQEVLNRLSVEFPEVIAVINGNKQAVEKDIVFIGLHPPVIAGLLEELKDSISTESIIVSLAPKHTISKISEISGKKLKVVRMIPNAPSIIGQGFNPVSFSENITEDDKKALEELFSALGIYKGVPEKNLEAYAVLTAMGPTYLWFQLFELREIVMNFGLSKEDADEGLRNMITGAAAVMFDSELNSEDVMDLIPSKPLADNQEDIKSIYREKLNAIYQKIKP